MERIFVTGHRNPDTDSIVSAMAYAALQNALGNQEYTAACLGRVSDETQGVLDRFGFEAPRLIADVRTQVKDLDYDIPPMLDCGVTINRAWEVMQANRISAIPVTMDGGKLFGMLSSGDVANYDMDSVRFCRVKNLPLYNLLSVIEGKLLNEAGQNVDSISGELTIALPTSRENLLFSGKGSIVICGAQPEMVRHAMEQGASCVIVCQAEVDEELRSMPSETCLISTPMDAYCVARLISQAMPVSHVCKTQDLVTFHLDDYIDDVKEVVLQSRFRTYPILDEEENVVGLLGRYHLLRPRRKRVVLVDHNEKSQSVRGLEQADIMAIIDHHRLGAVETRNPVFVRNDPVGSTATIVAEMYQDRGLMPTEKMAGLLASAIVSDTVMFKSPTCTPRDQSMAQRMARIANVSLEELGKLVFASSMGEDRSAEDLLNTDFKEFHIAGHSLAVSQVTCVDSKALLARKMELLDAMNTVQTKNGYDMVLLMLTDVLQEGTQLLFVGDEQIVQQAFNRRPEGNSVFLPKVMSRKKQIIPALSAMWG